MEDFATPDTIARFGVPLICFDILQRIDGVAFDTVYANGELLLVDDEVPVRYISADDLIRNKLASGRFRNLADVEAIRARQSAIKRSQP